MIDDILLNCFLFLRPYGYRECEIDRWRASGGWREQERYCFHGLGR